MNINFAMWGVERTGGVRVLFEIANRLTKKGHKVIITTLGKPGSHAWFPLEVSEIIYAEQKIYRADKKSPSSILNDSLRIMPESFLKIFEDTMRDRLRSQAVNVLANSFPKNIDANIATMCFSAYSVAKNMVGVPFYYLQHYESIFYDNPSTKHWIDGTYTLPLNKIANSSWLKSLIKERFDQSCGGPIVPAIDHNTFYPKNLCNNGSEKIIIALGKSTHWKGLHDLFQALKFVRREIPEIKLLLYGSEPYLKELSPIPCEYMARISDRKLADLYSMADVQVTPSWYESAPLPPLEAMACGTPVVTTRYGTEDYCFDHRNSLVVQPKNPKALANAIIEVLKDNKLRDRFSEGRAENCAEIYLGKCHRSG